MAMFINNKSALLFAGGVLVAAGLFASAYSPPVADTSGEKQRLDIEERAPARAGTPASDTPQTPEFGDYAPFAADMEEDLIDDTAGIDPSPGLIPSPTGDASAFPAGGDAFSGTVSAREEAPVSSASSTDRPAPPDGRSGSVRNDATDEMASRGLTNQAIRERLAAPPRISNRDN
jgi:hypothetical protein